MTNIQIAVICGTLCMCSGNEGYDGIGATLLIGALVVKSISFFFI